MAIVLKNPMPMNGALFVTNPKRKKSRKKSKAKVHTLASVLKSIKPKKRKSKRKISRRTNAGAPLKQAKFILQALNSPSVATINKMSKADIAAAKKQGRALQSKQKAEVAAAGSRIKWLQSRPKRKMYKASKAQLDAMMAKLGDTPKGTNRFTAYERRHGKSAASSSAKSSRAKSSSISETLTTGPKKKTRVTSAGLTADQKKKFAQYKKLGIAAAKAKKMAQEDADLIAGDMLANPWFGAKGPEGGHAGAAYIRWGKTKKGKQLLARYHKSKGRTRAASSAAGKSKYSKIFAQVSKEFKKRNFKTTKSRMKAIHKEVRKRMNAKASSTTSRTSAQRGRTRASSRKLNEYQKVNKMFGGLKLTSKLIRRAYEELSFLEQKQVVKQLKTLKKKKGESDKAHQKRVRSAATKLINDPLRDLRGRRVALNPKHKKNKATKRRKNPIAIRKNKGLGMVRSGVNKVGAIVKDKVPFIGKLAAPIVVSGLFGYGIYKVHTAVEPFALPLVEKGLDAVSSVPLVGPGARFVAERVALNPYLTLGAVVSIAAGLAAKKGLVTNANAQWLGGLAVVSGVVLDQSLKPFAKAAAAAVVEIEGADAVLDSSASPAQAGLYGDGGAYIIGAPSQALGAIGGSLSGIDREYHDAVMVDAYACSDTMHPDEVAAILAGDSYFIQKFGHSPSRVRKSPADYSRHAGRPGHRFGWLIKMVGFANLQKIAALPAGQRESVIRKLREQACASAPAMIAAAQAEQAATVESASLQMDNTFNGPCGFQDMGYGSLIFAGSDY